MSRIFVLMFAGSGLNEVNRNDSVFKEGQSPGIPYSSTLFLTRRLSTWYRLVQINIKVDFCLESNSRYGRNTYFKVLISILT